MIQSKEPVEIYKETGMENLDRVEEEFYQCQLTGLQQNVKRGNKFRMSIQHTGFYNRSGNWISSALLGHEEIFTRIFNGL